MRHIKSGGRLYICNQDINNKIFTDFVDRESLVIGSDFSDALLVPDSNEEGDGRRAIGLIPIHTSAQELLQNRWKALVVADSPDGILFSSGMRLLIDWNSDRSRYHWSDQEKKYLLDQLSLIGITEIVSVNDS